MNRYKWNLWAFLLWMGSLAWGSQLSTIQKTMNIQLQLLYTPLKKTDLQLGQFAHQDILHKILSFLDKKDIISFSECSKSINAEWREKYCHGFLSKTPFSLYFLAQAAYEQLIESEQNKTEIKDIKYLIPNKNSILWNQQTGKFIVLANVLSQSSTSTCLFENYNVCCLQGTYTKEGQVLTYSHKKFISRFSHKLQHSPSFFGENDLYCINKSRTRMAVVGWDFRSDNHEVELPLSQHLALYFYAMDQEKYFVYDLSELEDGFTEYLALEFDQESNNSVMLYAVSVRAGGICLIYMKGLGTKQLEITINYEGLRYKNLVPSKMSSDLQIFNMENNTLLEGISIIVPVIIAEDLIGKQIVSNNTKNKNLLNNCNTKNKNLSDKDFEILSFLQIIKENNSILNSKTSVTEYIDLSTVIGISIFTIICFGLLLYYRTIMGKILFSDEKKFSSERLF